MEPLLLRNTTLGYFCACELKYYYAVERRLASMTRSTPLDVGSLVHEGLKVYHHPINVGKSSQDRLELALKQVNQKLACLEGETESDWDATLPQKFLTRYAVKYPVDDFKVLSVEQDISFQLGDGIMFRGTVDMLTRLPTGDLVPWEHKTTKSLSSNLIQHHSRHPQTMGYAYCLSEVLKENIAWWMFNYIIKSVSETPNPKTKTASYDTRQKVLVHKVYLEQWRSWALQTGREIQDRMKTGIWRQNRYNCHPFSGRECPYIPLCFYGESDTTLALYRQAEPGGAASDLSGSEAAA